MQELGLLGKSLDSTDLGTIKNVNLPSIQAYAEQMGRKDLSAKIEAIIKKSTPGADKLDSGYRDQIANLKSLGLMGEESGAGVVKDSRAVDADRKSVV